MKRASAVLALFAGSAIACPVLEYAELDAMRPDQTLKIRCEYHAEMYDLVRLAGDNTKKGNTYAAQANLARGNGCAIQLERIDRILARKYNIVGDEKAVGLRIIEMCRQPK